MIDGSGNSSSWALYFFDIFTTTNHPSWNFDLFRLGINMKLLGTNEELHTTPNDLTVLTGENRSEQLKPDPCVLVSAQDTHRYLISD